MRDLLVAALQFLKAAAKKTETIIDDTLVDFILNNEKVLDFVAGLLDKFFNAAEAGTVQALDASALSAEEREFVDAQAIDIIQLIGLIRLIIDFINQIRK